MAGSGYTESMYTSEDGGYLVETVMTRAAFSLSLWAGERFAAFWFRFQEKAEAVVYFPIQQITISGSPGDRALRWRRVSQVTAAVRVVFVE